MKGWPGYIKNPYNLIIKRQVTQLKNGQRGSINVPFSKDYIQMTSKHEKNTLDIISH